MHMLQEEGTGGISGFATPSSTGSRANMDRPVAYADGFCISPLENLDCTYIQNWPKWIRRFERSRVASGLNVKNLPFQDNTLIYSMGDEGEDILNASPLTEEEKLNYCAIKDCVEMHFIGRHI